MKTKILYGIIAGLVLALLLSCDVQREVSKTKDSTDLKEVLERTTTRKGDTVSYKTVLHVKDTTIYTVNRQGTTLKTVYDSNGNVSQVDCFASAISEILKYNKDLQQESSTKDKTERYRIDTNIIYAVAGVVLLLGGLALFFIMRTINRHGAILEALGAKL
jgi:hypothetical protein